MDLNYEMNHRAKVLNTQLDDFLNKGSPKILYDAARHLPFAGGKRLRPCMAMVSCESVGGDVKNVIFFAIALELIHNFTLVHDDIMDKSKLRRNMPTVHVKFGEPTAINAGDLLFTKAFEAMHELLIEPHIFKKLEYGLVKCIKDICEGQQMDMDFENRIDVMEEEYLEMIRKKTAVFFRLATEGGAILSDANLDQINALGNYGELLGLAFQIHDDFLDMSSDEDTLGKDIGNDIRNGKKTLIAVRSLNKAEGEYKRSLHDIFGNKFATESDVKKVYDIFQDLNSVEYARQKALYYCEKAKKSLDILDESKAKQILIEIADYSIKREN
jgi:geranylgeranyl diphosphate synthase type I